jgi:hypothetical protein
MTQRLNIREHFWRGNAQAGYELLIVAARQSAEVLGVARAAGRPGPRFRSRATRRR